MATEPHAVGSANALSQTRSVESELFSFSDDDFEQVRRLIYRHAGISLSDSKRNMVYSRLVRRLRAVEAPTFASYLETVQHGSGPEWQHFVNALTTNLTSFYREAHHFPILAKHLREMPRSGAIRIWCCAASTGEEPYTIAFTALEALGTSASRVEIVATDIDTAVLAKAERGIYPREAVAKLDQARLTRFFQRGRGANEGLARVRPEVRALVRFEQLNLLDEKWPVGGDFSAIFCRNVMIYFDKETQLKLARRLAQAASPTGLLFFGHSENLAAARDRLEPRGQTVYRPIHESSQRSAHGSANES
jgi:chemotaxis protein methyltransferase CheR